MTTTPELKVNNPLNLFDGCWVKLKSGNTVGPLHWEEATGLFKSEKSIYSWFANGIIFGGSGFSENNIHSLVPTPREPVKVPEPWTAWRNVYGDALSIDMHPTLEKAILRRDIKFTCTHEIECRVVRVHFHDGTIQEVKP